MTVSRVAALALGRIIWKISFLHLLLKGLILIFSSLSSVQFPIVFFLVVLFLSRCANLKLDWIFVYRHLKRNWMQKWTKQPGEESRCQSNYITRMHPVCDTFFCLFFFALAHNSRTSLLPTPHTDLRTIFRLLCLSLCLSVCYLCVVCVGGLVGRWKSVFFNLRLIWRSWAGNSLSEGVTEVALSDSDVPLAQVCQLTFFTMFADLWWKWISYADRALSEKCCYLCED